MNIGESMRKIRIPVKAAQGSRGPAGPRGPQGQRGPPGQSPVISESILTRKYTICAFFSPLSNNSVPEKCKLLKTNT